MFHGEGELGVPAIQTGSDLSDALPPLHLVAGFEMAGMNSCITYQDVLGLPVFEKAVLQPDLVVFQFGDGTASQCVNRLIRSGVAPATALPGFMGFKPERSDDRLFDDPVLMPALSGLVLVARLAVCAADGKIEAVSEVWREERLQILS